MHSVFLNQSVRYVGDMLAWLHQATASEKEHLEALLKQVTIQGTHRPTRSAQIILNIVKLCLCVV